MSDKKLTKEQALAIVDRAKRYFGGEDGTVEDFAKAMCCTPAWIYKQASRGEFNPDFARDLELATKGAILRVECNPRLFS